MHANVDACGHRLMDSALSAGQLPAGAKMKHWSSVQTWGLEDMLTACSMLDAELHLLAQFWMLNFTCTVSTMTAFPNKGKNHVLGFS
jgi:hypothetical protein